MEDIFFVTPCDHRIKNYELKIVGKPGNYTAKFPAPPIQLKNRIFIRSWNDEQTYLQNIKSYKDVQSPICNNAINAPINGANAIIGIVDYAFITDDTIKFLDPTDNHPTVNPDPNLIPANKYLVDFTAIPEYCPRCLGSSVVKDVNINNRGYAEYVTDGGKIKQRVLKALMTPLGASPYDVTFGSELDALIGRTITEELRISMQKTIVNAVQNLIDNQSPELTEKERINAIQGITIDTPTEDQSTLYVKVLVSSIAGEIIDCSVGFSLGDKNV